jgi:hypothetical protein
MSARRPYSTKRSRKSRPSTSPKKTNHAHAGNSALASASVTLALAIRRLWY